MSKLLASTAIIAIIGTLVAVSMASFVPDSYAFRIPADLIGYSESQITVVEDNQDIDSGFCTYNGIQFADLIIKDIVDGSIIKQTTTGSQVILEATIVNECDDRGDQPFILLLEVRDPDGITDYLAWQLGVINSDVQAVGGSSWVVPDRPGEYEVRAFVIGGNLNDTGILHPVIQYSLTVMSD